MWPRVAPAQQRLLLLCRLQVQKRRQVQVSVPEVRENLFAYGNPSERWINVGSHSDRNSPCCKNCQYEKATKKCQEPISATCKGQSFCTGEHIVSSSHFVSDTFKKKKTTTSILSLSSQGTAVSVHLQKMLPTEQFVSTTAAVRTESVTPSARPCRT